jgi:hypothetical protein
MPITRWDTGGPLAGNHDQAFWWANHIAYDWQDAEKHHHTTTVHVAVCKETWDKNGQSCQSTWAWVSGAPVTKKNVLERCNRAGRHRWGIEENFLAEKSRDTTTSMPSPMTGTP